MPKLTRTRTPDRETLTLRGEDYEVTVEIGTRGLELSAADVELLLHTPLALLAERIRETI